MAKKTSKNKKPTLASTGKRIGAFSTEDRKYILANLDKSDEYIAEHLQRNEKAVTRERRQLVVNRNLKPKLNEEITEEEEALTILKLKPTWDASKLHWNPTEIRIAEYHWIKLYKQFRGDMLHSEETQVFKLIELEILLIRNNKEKKDLLDQIEELEKEIADLRKFDNKSEIIPLQQLISSLKSNRIAVEKTYNDLLGRHRELMIQLKGTREQRIKQIEEGKKTFFDWIKALNDDEYRTNESRRAELFTVAMNKEKVRLSDYHKYDDGMVDQPILSADTILDDNIDSDIASNNVDDILDNSTEEENNE